MKKIVSLLLAGVMGLTMASGVAAEVCTNDYSMIYNTIAGSSPSIYSPYFGYFHNGNLLLQDMDGKYVPLKDYYYWLYLQQLQQNAQPEVDPGFTMSPSEELWNKYWDYATPLRDTYACPEKDCKNTKCTAYLVPSTSGYAIMTYCAEHGYKLLNGTPVVTPNAKTYDVISYYSAGGKIFLNSSVTTSSATVAAGGKVQVSVVPDSGYKLEYVIVNGVNVGDNNSFTLDNIRSNYYISAVFSKINVHIPYTVTAKAEGNGTVYAVVDNKSVGAIGSVTGTYANDLSLRFVPASDSYKVKNVTINGVSMGGISVYNMNHFLTGLNVVATFEWINPYSDVKEHLAAVEYVTEFGIMGAPDPYSHEDEFRGKSAVTVKALACYLAELTDVDDILNKVSDRIAWAEKKGLIAADEDLTAAADWERTCEMLEALLRTTEKDNKFTYTELVNADSAYKVAAAMDLVDEVSYKANKNITRYDMAEICYAVSQLSVK